MVCSLPMVWVGWQNLNGISVLYAYLVHVFWLWYEWYCVYLKMPFHHWGAEWKRFGWSCTSCFLYAVPLEAACAGIQKFISFLSPMSIIPILFLRNRTGFPEQNHSFIKSRKKKFLKQRNWNWNVGGSSFCVICIVWFPSRKTKKSLWT